MSLTHKQSMSLALRFELLDNLTKLGLQNGQAAHLVRHTLTRELRKAFGRTFTFDAFGYPVGLRVAEWDALMAAREVLYRERQAARAAQEREQAEQDRVTRATVEAAQFAAGVTA